MSNDYNEKLEKKKRKAEYKLEKKRLEQEYEQKKKKLERKKEAASKREREEESVTGTSPEPRSTGLDKTTIEVVLPEDKPKPWYKDPNWLRAIASIVVMVIVILTFYLTYVR